jgi:hypothetical protein
MRATATTTLFAALDIATGEVIVRRIAAPWRESVSCISCSPSKPTFPPKMDVHLVMDNYGTHKTPTIKGLVRPQPEIHGSTSPRPRLLAQPGRAQVLRLPRDADYIRRGTHRSTRQLETSHSANTWI